MNEPLEPDLVPELLVQDVRKSLNFWCGICGFSTVYDRLAEGFSYIARGSAHLMLEQRGVGRNWLSGELRQPFGRGINFQISIDDLESILTALADAGWPLFMEPETKWYQVASGKAGVRQFLVADPDGYLIRFQQPLGHRRVPKG